MWFCIVYVYAWITLALHASMYIMYGSNHDASLHPMPIVACMLLPLSQGGMGFIVNYDTLPAVPSWVDTSCGGACSSGEMLLQRVRDVYTTADTRQTFISSEVSVCRLSNQYNIQTCWSLTFLHGRESSVWILCSNRQGSAKVLH